MEGNTKSRFLILFISFVMFIIQFKTAVINLANPPQVDSTIIKNIENIELPIITICPFEQENHTMLNFYGYEKRIDILKGSTTYNKTSWGHLQNLSFNELLEKVFDKNIANEIEVYNQEEIYFGEIVFIPKYGYCKEITTYNANQNVVIKPPKHHQQLRVFISDGNFRSLFSIDSTSIKGYPIIVWENQSYSYEVDVSISSSCKVTSQEIVDTKEEFKECVDDKVQDAIGMPLGCVPPWLSNKNQCNETYKHEFYEIAIPNFVQSYVDPPFELGNIKIEKECRKYCSRTRSITQYRQRYMDAQRALIKLAFNEDVSVTEKVFSYTPFQFIVDIGSSLGLWMGLSVLDLFDLGIQCINTLKSLKLFKKVN